MNKTLLSLLTASTVVFTSAAHAQLISVPVPDASFESPAVTSPGSPFDVSSSNLNLVPSWTAALSDGNNNNPYGFSNNSILTSAGTSDGAQSLYAQVYYNYTNTTLTTTNPVLTLAPSTTYTLTVAIGAPATPGTFEGTSGTVGESAGQADIFLLANGVAIAGQTVANTAVNQGSLQDYMISFTTGDTGGVIGQALTIQLEADKAFYPGDNADPGNETVIFDNVRLTETPEPSTYAMLLGGAGFLLLMARRLRRA